MSGLIGGLIAYLLFALVAGAARRKTRHGLSEAAAYYGTVARVCFGVTAVGCIGIFGFVVYSGTVGNPTAIWPIYALVGAIALMAIGGFYDSFVRRADWAESAVRFSKWNGVRTVAWTDITTMEIKASLQYTRIGFRDGSGFAISELMTGYDSFVRAAEYRGISLTENGRPFKH